MGGRAFRDKGVDVKLCRAASLRFDAIIFRDCHLARSIHSDTPPQLLSRGIAAYAAVRSASRFARLFRLSTCYVIRARRMDIWPIWNGP